MQCLQCFTGFEITSADRAFYQKMDVPEPTLCPLCRMQQRYTWRNERKLYRRACDRCHKKMISCFVDPELTVYCRECWWGDQWDPSSYGRDFDFNRPFFEQFAELERSIPHFQLFQDGSSENCDYCNYGFSSKSCYLCSGPAWCEEVYYSWGGIKCKNCIDLMKAQACEECYECTECTLCTRMTFSTHCTQCHDSAFLANCHNCQNCFGSINLNRKQYVFLGQQLSKEEYEKRMASIQLTSEKVREMLRYLDQLSARSVHRSTVGTNSNNSSGDYLDHADNCFLCFDIIGGAKECAYSEGIGAGGAQNLYDCSFGGIGSIDVYNSMGFSAHNKVIAQLYGRECHDCSYNQYCFSSHDLFGCIGLRHGEYMILNKKYSKEDYFNLKSLIINHMRKTGEWGNFFPAQYSPYAYNETIAQDFFPLTKEEVIKRHWKWKDENRLHAARQETKIIRSCQECKKSFQMIDQELLFYKKFNLPNPDRCPECRFQRRFQLRNPRKLYSRACAKCAMPIQTTYSTERPEIVYCENCYLKEVY